MKPAGQIDLRASIFDRAAGLFPGGLSLRTWACARTATATAAGTVFATTLFVGCTLAGAFFKAAAQNLGRQTDVLARAAARFRCVSLLHGRLRRLSFGLLVLGLVLIWVLAWVLVLVLIALIAAIALALAWLVILRALFVRRPLVVATLRVIALIALTVALIGTLATLVLVALAVVVLVLILLLLRLEARVQHPVIVVGMLEIVFRRDPVAHRAGVARHRQELFHQLLRIAARTHAAIKIRIARTTPASAAGRTRFAAIIAAALTVFHEACHLEGAYEPFERTSLNR